MAVGREFGRVGVLMGGPSSERQISLKSGKAIYEALRQAGLDVVAVDITTDNRQENEKLINSVKINCAFLALHGSFGEDGRIQAILEGIGLPYTGSGVSASKLAMDKVVSRRIFESSGLAVPRYRLIHKGAAPADIRKAAEEFALPWVVKPATQGSSIGLSILYEDSGLDKAVKLALGFDQTVIIEEYIKGRELTVGILEEEALPVIEIIPSKKFFDYEAKYSSGLTEYVVPAKLDEALAEKAKSSALRAHKLLGCFGCSRVDIILSQTNVPYVLEVNTIPGFTATSLLPKAAGSRGIDFTQLCLRLLKLAYAKKKSS
jgi:D-alanine-D-alanine ligase